MTDPHPADDRFPVIDGEVQLCRNRAHPAGPWHTTASPGTPLWLRLWRRRSWGCTCPAPPHQPAEVVGPVLVTVGLAPAGSPIVDEGVTMAAGTRFDLVAIRCPQRTDRAIVVPGPGGRAKPARTVQLGVRRAPTQGRPTWLQPHRLGRPLARWRARNSSPTTVVAGHDVGVIEGG